MTPRRFFCGLLLLLVLLPVSSPADVISKVAAVVNDSIITTYQLERKLQQFLAMNPAAASIPESEQEKMRRELLDRMVEDELVRQRVKALKIEVSDKDVDAAINDVQSQNGLTREQLVAALQQQGMEFEEYRRNLREQILRYKLLGREVQSQVEVTSKEVRNYFRDNIDQYRKPPYMHLSRLTFAIPSGSSDEDLETIRQRAIDTRKELESGKGLNEVLISLTPEGGVSGGDMGRFRPGELTAEFDEAVRDLETGEVSRVVEAASGFFIFKMEERNPGEVAQLDSVRAEIEELLLEKAREKAFADWRTGLKEKAYIDIRI